MTSQMFIVSHHFYHQKIKFLFILQSNNYILHFIFYIIIGDSNVLMQILRGDREHYNKQFAFFLGANLGFIVLKIIIFVFQLANAAR